jgi:hypothetical protein
MVAGLYNPWIEKSLAKLAERMPGRYAKFEASSGFLDSIDRYAYHAPSVPRTAEGAAESGAAPPPAGAAQASTSVEVAPPAAAADGIESVEETEAAESVSRPSFDVEVEPVLEEPGDEPAATGVSDASPH